jgi:hypothetical protein
MHGALGVEQLVAFVSAIAMAVLVVVQGGLLEARRQSLGVN